MKRKSLLDSFAVLAWIQDEEGAQVVEDLLYGAQRGEGQIIMNIINLGEVTYRIGKLKGEDEAKETLDEIRRLPLTVVPATEEAVFSAAGFKMHYAISYADAFAAAAAEELGAVLVTGDPELEQLGSRIQMEKLQRNKRT